MSTLIELDSKLRDRTQYSNPASFSVLASQTQGWPSIVKDTQCVKPCIKKEACNMLYCFVIKEIIVPFRRIDGAGVTIEVIAQDPYNQAVTSSSPWLYLNLSCNKFSDRGLIRTIGGVQRDATFVLIQTGTVIGEPDAGGIRTVWGTFKSRSNQCMRFETNAPVITFRLFTNQTTSLDGPFSPLTTPQVGMSQNSNDVRIYGDDLPTTLLPIPFRQVRALIEVTPFLRDGGYDNQLVSLWGQ